MLPRVQLPPGCGGFKDGNRRIIAERGPGSFVNLDDGDPQLKKLRNQDYASAGLVDAGPEKFYTRKAPDGRWCQVCMKLWHGWRTECFCGQPTVPESEIVLPRMQEYVP
jgi:hypothetical protein